MANISLEGSIRTCKVDTGWASKLESDRFMNPNLMVCPAWKGVDTAGRAVCPDSFWTKTAGCNSASDRVTVENALRPQYIEYVTLNADGIRGGLDCDRGMNRNADGVCGRKTLNDVYRQTGQYGYVTGFNQDIYPNCMSCKNYPDAQAFSNGQTMKEQFSQIGKRTNDLRRYY